jgi:hypothetical protein
MTHHHDDKRQIRKHKKEIKRLGNKRVRRQLKKNLESAPSEAHLSEVDFGRLSSEPLNGLDRPV